MIARQLLFCNRNQKNFSTAHSKENLLPRIEFRYVVFGFVAEQFAGRRQAEAFILRLGGSEDERIADIGFFDGTAEEPDGVARAEPDGPRTVVVAEGGTVVGMEPADADTDELHPMPVVI